jgi:PTS system mannose-specific IIA component
VLVTHGRLADEFGAALEHVMGPQEQMEAITIGAYDDPDLCRTAIIEAVNRVDSGDGVVILTDMFGGMPSNLAISCMNRPNVDLLAGMNLPMLVKLAKVRQDRPLREAIDLAQEAGRKYVTIASSVLAGKRTPSRRGDRRVSESFTKIRRLRISTSVALGSRN